MTIDPRHILWPNGLPEYVSTATEGIRVAIELLTLWTDVPETSHEVARRVHGLDVEGRLASDVVPGLLNVGLFLGGLMAALEGQDDVAEGTRGILADISLQMPERPA